MRRGLLIYRRDTHQSVDFSPYRRGARDEGVGLARAHARLPRFRAGVDLGEQARLAGRISAIASAEGGGDLFPIEVSMASKKFRPLRAPCCFAVGRSGEARFFAEAGGACAQSPHLACASCTRFSPKTTLIATAMVGQTSSARKVLETAIRRTESGRNRPQSGTIPAQPQKALDAAATASPLLLQWSCLALPFAAIVFRREARVLSGRAAGATQTPPASIGPRRPSRE